MASHTLLEVGVIRNHAKACFGSQAIMQMSLWHRCQLCTNDRDSATPAWNSITQPCSLEEFASNSEHLHTFTMINHNLRFSHHQRQNIKKESPIRYSCALAHDFMNTDKQTYTKTSLLRSTAENVAMHKKVQWELNTRQKMSLDRAPMSHHVTQPVICLGVISNCVVTCRLHELEP